MCPLTSIKTVCRETSLKLFEEAIPDGFTLISPPAGGSDQFLTGTEPPSSSTSLERDDGVCGMKLIPASVMRSEVLGEEGSTASTLPPLHLLPQPEPEIHRSRPAGIHLIS